MASPTVHVDMNKKCAECGKEGAVDSGICLACTIKASKMKPMKSWQGKAVQKRIKDRTL